MTVGKRGRLVCAARAMLLVATVIAVYLGLATLGMMAVGCGEGTACAGLLSSGWSRVFGLPVAFVGAGAYLALACLAQRLARDESAGLAQVGLVLMLLIPAVAVWFVGIQALVIKSFCPWCCAAHALAVAAVIALWLVRRACRRDNGGTRVGLTQRAVATALSVPLYSAFVVAVSVSSPGGAGAGRAKGDATAMHSVAPEQASSVDAPKPLGFPLELHVGEASIWPEEMPSLGNASAEHLVVLLGDLTCGRSRALYAMLEDIVEVYGDQLGVVILPGAGEGESATIQRIALALHRENPELFHALAASLGSGLIPAELAAVRGEAKRLLGGRSLSESLDEHGSWIDSQLAAATRVREANAEGHGGRRALPQLMMAGEVMFGANPSPGHYIDLLQSKFPLRQMATVGTVVGSGSGNKRPILGVESSELALGELASGEFLMAYIPIRNMGEAPLLLDWIKSSPGIEVAQLPSRNIEPGGRGMIALEVRAPERPGPFRQPVVIYSNARPEGAAIHIAGTVVPQGLQQASAASGEPE